MFSGGGINGASAGITLTRVTASSNSASYVANDYSQFGGGAFYFEYAIGPTTLIDCIITNNTVQDDPTDGVQAAGGALFVYQASSPVIIMNTTVTGNGVTAGSSLGVGGGIAVESTDTYIYDSVISNNTAFYGGGLYFVYINNIMITNTTITFNTVTEDGGGVYVDSSVLLMMNASEITSNTASGSGGGLAVYSSYGSTDINYCI